MAQSTAINTETNKPIKSLTQTVSIGTAHIVVDSDNDTNLDPEKDPLAAATGKKFSFWQAAHPTPSAAGNNGQDALLDFAPIRVYAGAVPDPSLGKIQLLLKSANYTATFLITKNVGVPDAPTDAAAAQNEKNYLTDSVTAQNVMKNTNGFPAPCSVANGSSFAANLCQSVLASDNVSTTVELNGLTTGQMSDVLLAVSNINCPTPGVTTCATDGSATLQVVLVKTDNSIVVLDQGPVDIRPLQSWMTVETVRNGTSVTPGSYPVLDTGGWEDIPSAAQTLVVLVHGFDNSDNDVQTHNFPDWFKRLYWAGHDVLLSQHNTQTVGISWPSNPGLTAFPVAQFSALETGIPLAKWLTDQSLAQGRKIEIFAHSLDNMVTNSALSRPEFQANSVTSYVMNEAAVPAEAFYQSYPSDPFFDQHGLDYGWSDTPLAAPPNSLFDQPWQSQWATLDHGFAPGMQPQWVNTLSGSSYVTSPQPIYQLRWNQQRPTTGVPDNAPINSTPARGSW